MSESFAEPIITAYPVRTVEEAYDYVLYHTSFHFGRAHEILGIP